MRYWLPNDITPVGICDHSFTADDSELSDDDSGRDSPAQSTLPQRSEYIYMYISITIVQSYTRKYHEFVVVCIVTSVQ